MNPADRPDRATWTDALRLLDEALDLAPSERAAWLTTLASPSSAVKALIARLLAERALIETDDFLGHGPPLPEWHESAFEADQLIGPYRLVRQLGRGGMAVVWLAERADAAHRRPVALKLPAIDHARAPVIAARFLRERLILSELVHPHIASVLDAGSDRQQPWLAMEFVDGTTINAYCDEHALDIPARLELFVQVLRAVQYAHAHGVIHRDIKPGNVLVDGNGQVKLVDFGVARLLAETDDGANAGANDDGTMTRWGGRPLTPVYASPEQVTGGSVGTASDVYSLGVVLYELLVGQRPRLSPAWTEPPRPSRGTRGEGAIRPPGVPAGRWARALQGDLDTILVKSLQHEAADRYVTVAAFAEDIQRHLAQRPILARPDSLWYRAAKFTSRHRLGVAATAAISVALAVALASASWQAHLARIEGDRARATRSFLVGLFDNSARRGAEGTPAYQVTGRELLEVGARRLLTDYQAPTELRLELLTLLGSLSEELDLVPQARTLTDDAVVLARQLYGTQDVRFGAALLAAAEVKARAADYHAALDEGGRALAVLEQNRSASVEHRAQAQILIGNALDQLERYDESRTHLEAALHLLADAGSVSEQRARVNFYLARSYEASGDLARAEALYREGIAVAERNFGPRSYLAAFGYENFGDLLRQQSRFPEAEDYLRRSLDVYAVVLGPDHLTVSGARYELAMVYAATGRRVEADRMIADAIALSDRVAGPFQPSIGGYQTGRRAALLLAMGDLDGARALYVRVLEHWPRGDGLRSQRITVWGLAYSRLLIADGHEAAAAALLDEVDEELATKPADDRYAAPERIQSIARRAELAVAGGDVARARSMIAAAWQRPLPVTAGDLSAPLALVEALSTTRPDAATARAAVDTFATLGNEEAYARRDVETRARLDLALGRLLLAADDLPAAHVRLVRADELRRRIDVPRSPWRAETERVLADCMTRGGQRNAARPLRLDADAILAAHPGLQAMTGHSGRT